MKQIYIESKTDFNTGSFLNYEEVVEVEEV